MHLLTITFGPGSTAWALLFRTEVAAKVVLNIITTQVESRVNCWIVVEDDFGQLASLFSGAIHGYMLEDLDKSKVAQIERGLHQARTQARAQQQAAADPILKNAANVRGPAMLDPMGNGRFS